METELVKRIFATAGSLDRKTRRRLAPGEAAAGRKYDKSFETLKAAVANDPGAERALFILDESATALAVAEAQISQRLTLIEASRRDSFVCGGKLVRLVPLSEIPPRSPRICR